MNIVMGIKGMWRTWWGVISELVHSRSNEILSTSSPATFNCYRQNVITWRSAGSELRVIVITLLNHLASLGVSTSFLNASRHVPSITTLNCECAGH